MAGLSIENLFQDRRSTPSDDDLQSALGIAWSVWKGLIEFLKENYPQAILDWKFMKSGWTLTPVFKKRVICYLAPGANEFRAGFTLGEKAVAAALSSDLPVSLKQTIETARPYVEGRGFYIKASTPDDLKDLTTLVRLKLNRY
jgi:hypothetical protein